MSAALLPIEQTRLEELERVVERGLTTFVEVGRALLEIRDRKLFRASHKTFESYVRERWQFTAGRARQLIGAAAVAGELESVTRVALPSERHARALAPLVKEQGAEAAAEIWNEISAKGVPTVAQLEKAVTNRAPKPVSTVIVEPTTLEECIALMREGIVCAGRAIAGGSDFAANLDRAISIERLVFEGRCFLNLFTDLRQWRTVERCTGLYTQLSHAVAAAAEAADFGAYIDQKIADVTSEERAVWSQFFEGYREMKLLGDEEQRREADEALESITKLCDRRIVELEAAE